MPHAAIKQMVEITKKIGYNDIKVNREFFKKDIDQNKENQKERE